jgi:membrane protein YdbS with pleckstrin-like domain
MRLKYWILALILMIILSTISCVIWGLAVGSMILWSIWAILIVFLFITTIREI